MDILGTLMKTYGVDAKQVTAQVDGFRAMLDQFAGAFRHVIAEQKRQAEQLDRIEAALKHLALLEAESALGVCRGIDTAEFTQVSVGPVDCGHIQPHNAAE